MVGGQYGQIDEIGQIPNGPLFLPEEPYPPLSRNVMATLMEIGDEGFRAFGLLYVSRMRS